MQKQQYRGKLSSLVYTVIISGNFIFYLLHDQHTSLKINRAHRHRWHIHCVETDWPTKHSRRPDHHTQFKVLSNVIYCTSQINRHHRRTPAFSETLGERDPFIQKTVVNLFMVSLFIVLMRRMRLQCWSKNLSATAGLVKSQYPPSGVPSSSKIRQPWRGSLWRSLLP